MNGLDQIILANRLADKAHAANNARIRRNLAGERAAAKHAAKRATAPRTKSGRITEINP
jgi:hypothetical protein